MQDLAFASASRLAGAIRSREVSSLEVVQACLDRIAAVNPKLNAVVQLRGESALAEAADADRALARGEARGPLHGVPITLKDSHDTVACVSTWGTPGRARFVPREDATAAGRLLRAGAILLGKTNTPEFTLSFETDNPVYGRTANPYDLGRTPGGSSGGAAATLAAGGSPLDLGSDTGGSIRLPAHFCGIAGIRPTSGRVPRTGHAIGWGGLVQSLTSLGPMARFVEDLALALPLVSGPDGRDPHVVPMPLGDPADVDLGGLRVALHSDNGIETPTEAIREAVRAAGRLLEGAGARVEELRPPGIEETLELFMGLMTADGGAWLRLLLERAGTPPEASSLRLLAEPRPVSGDALARLLERWDRFRSRMLGFAEVHDLILCPPSARAALPHGSERTSVPCFTYTMTWNLTGWPGAVVRAGTSAEGLPVGVQLVARPWREDVALAAAALVERGLGGFQPPGALIGAPPRAS